MPPVSDRPTRRRTRVAGGIYKDRYGLAATVKARGGKSRAGNWQLVSDNMDKRAYPPQVFNVTDVNLLDALVGEVVWTGRYLGSGKKADVRNMKHKRSSA